MPSVNMIFGLLITIGVVVLSATAFRLVAVSGTIAFYDNNSCLFTASSESSSESSNASLYFNVTDTVPFSAAPPVCNTSESMSPGSLLRDFSSSTPFL